MPEPTIVVSKCSAIKRADQIPRSWLLHFWLGEYHPNPNPNIKQRVYERIYEKNVYAVDCKKYRVLWDNSRISELFSNCLSKELSSAALPQDQPPSYQQNNPELPPYGQALMDEEEEEIQEPSVIKKR